MRPMGEASTVNIPTAVAPCPGAAAPGAQRGTERLLPFLCPGSTDNRAAIFKLAFSFPLQRCLNGFPLAYRSTGSADVVSHCERKGYRVQNKSEIIHRHSWDQNSRLLSSADVIAREGRLRIQTVPRQGSRTDPAASQHPGVLRAERNEPFWPCMIRDNLAGEVPKLPWLPNSCRASHKHHSSKKEPSCVTLTAGEREEPGRWTLQVWGAGSCSAGADGAAGSYGIDQGTGRAGFGEPLSTEQPL